MSLGAIPTESVVPDVSGSGTTATAPNAGPPPILSRPPSAVVSARDDGMAQGLTAHSGGAPSSTHSGGAPSSTPSAQTARRPTVPAQSRPPSAPLAQSRPASVATSHSRHGSVARALGMTQMGPQIARPPSSSVLASNVEILSAAAAAALPRPSTARLPPASTQARPGSRTQYAVLPTLAEALPVSATPSIPAAVWGDLAAHAKQWRKAIRVALLNEGQLRCAYDLVDHLEDASTARDIAVAQQQLSQLLPGVDASLVLPGQNAPPRPQSHTLPPLPCDYPSPASGHFPNEVEQPRPMQHGPSAQASWLQSPSVLFHSRDDHQQQHQQPAQTDGPDSHMRLHRVAQAQSTLPRDTSQQEPAPAAPPSLSGGHGQHGQFTAAAQSSFNTHRAHQPQPFTQPPGLPIFGTSWQHGQNIAFGQHAYNTGNAYNTSQGYHGAYTSDGPHAYSAAHAQTSAPAQYRFAESSPPSASGLGYSRPPFSPPHTVNPQQTLLMGSMNRPAPNTAGGTATALVAQGGFSGYRSHDCDAFRQDDDDDAFEAAELTEAMSVDAGPVDVQDARWPIRPAAPTQNAPAAGAALAAMSRSPVAGAVSPTHGKSSAAAAASTAHKLPAAAASSTTHAPPAAAASSTTHAPPAAAAGSTTHVPPAAAAGSSSAAPAAMPSAAPPPPPAGVRSVAAPTKGGRLKQRGNAATLRNLNPEEDALKLPLRLPFPKTPHGRFKSRRRRREEIVERLLKVFLRMRTEIFELAKELGEDPIELLREAMMGTGFGKESPWNLFEQFYSMKPGEWDVRDSYDFTGKTTHEAWADFKANTNYERVLLRFAWTFPDPSAIKTVGKMDQFFLSIRDHFHEAQTHLAAVHGIQVSIIMAGQNSETDSGFVSVDMAPNAKGYFDMFGMPLDVVGRTYQNTVQHTADMNEVAGRVGKPVPRTSLDLELRPRLTDPTRYESWDLARIYNDNMMPLYEAANPHIVPIPKRASECQFLVHMLLNMKNELCIDNWPWWLPLPYSPTLNVDRGLQCYGLRETQYLIQWLCMRDPDDPMQPHPLGPRLTFAGERTDPETPLPTIRTTPVNYPGSDWHGRVLTYSVANHMLVTPTALELRMWRQLTGEIDRVYHFEHHGKDPREKPSDDTPAAGSSASTVPAARSNGRRGPVSSAIVHSDLDASGDEDSAGDGVHEQPAAAARKRTRSQVAAQLPPLPLDDAGTATPPEMFDGSEPTGADNAYWLPPSGNTTDLTGFPGGVPDGFSVWTCVFAKAQSSSKRKAYKVKLTKARIRTIERIRSRLPAPALLPINDMADDVGQPAPQVVAASSSARPPQPAPISPRKAHNQRGSTSAAAYAPVAPPAAAAKAPASKKQTAPAAVPVAAAAAAKPSPRTAVKRRRGDDADSNNGDAEQEFEEFANKRARVDNPAATQTPSRKAIAAAAATPKATPSRTSAAAAETPSRTPGRQLTVEMPGPPSRAVTPAPQAAEKQFRTSMIDQPEGPAPQWLSLVPANLEPASIQTAFHRVGIAMKRRRTLPEDFCAVIEDLILSWPVNEPVPDDLQYIMGAVHDRDIPADVPMRAVPRPGWLKSVPAGFDPRAVQTAFYRVSIAHKLCRDFPSEDAALIQALGDALPVHLSLPDDLHVLYDKILSAND
ncbi:hypothetical protein AURDEDRAFT_176155 [Auricularia subglabra TFB-10046 SS5]|uniref:Uncharacterized protein n=1 Tax=Auricularia subglabra (strain TFB-10046 / SS5) TaxID=717982 RepID=J0LDN5_AURST|nr:hypothetical protein AURDEDRAFT_176155 [Auricularia subglabra TFB-10046 SS5]